MQTFALILREAHSLKGTAGTFGLRRLAQYGADLEREACARSIQTNTAPCSHAWRLCSRQAGSDFPAASTLAA